MWRGDLKIVEFLRQVRDRELLSVADIHSFVEGVASGDLPDYQVAAFLMAVYQCGLSDESLVATFRRSPDESTKFDISLCDTR